MDKGDYMKKLTRYQRVLLTLSAFLIAFTLVTGLSQTAKTVNGVAFNAFQMLEYTLIERPIQFISNMVQDFQTLWSTKEENDLLKKTIAEMSFNAFEFSETQRQLSELKDLLAINDRYAQYHKVNANVISRDPALWNNYLIIDVGTNQGIEENMAVMSSTGLIGKIEEVYADTAKVKLLTTTDHSNKVSLKIIYNDNQSADAILESYDIERKSFVIRLFSNNDDIKVGDYVVTSGMGGVFPPGLNVGKVNQIINLNNKLGKNIYVTPDANFQDFQFVSVIDLGDADEN